MPKWRDIRELTGKDIIERIGRPTLISAGFPCQDTSCAGLQTGISGKRSGLVFEFLRLLADVRPNYALFENVGGFRSNGLHEILTKLAEIGYDAEWYSIRASGFGAPHKRERVFVLAHSKRYEQPSSEPRKWAIGRVGGIVKSIPWNESCGSALCKFRGMDDGTTYKVDRIDTIRNAVIPQQVYPILKAIADIERGEVNGT